MQAYENSQHHEYRLKIRWTYRNTHQVLNPAVKCDTQTILIPRRLLFIRKGIIIDHQHGENIP